LVDTSKILFTDACHRAIGDIDHAKARLETAIEKGPGPGSRADVAVVVLASEISEVADCIRSHVTVAAKMDDWEGFSRDLDTLESILDSVAHLPWPTEKLRIQLSEVRLAKYAVAWREKRRRPWIENSLRGAADRWPYFCKRLDPVNSEHIAEATRYPSTSAENEAPGFRRLLEPPVATP
jgi:hypothetical protein